MIAPKHPEEPHTRRAFDETDGEMTENIREVVILTKISLHQPRHQSKKRRTNQPTFTLQEKQKKTKQCAKSETTNKKQQKHAAGIEGKI